MNATKDLKKLDLAILRPTSFKAKQQPEVVELEEAHYLTLDGRGLPTLGAAEATHFQDAVGALYTVAYGLKMQAKHRGQDFKVSKLEAQWLPYRSFGDGTRDLDMLEREGWRWKLMIMVPDYITEADVEAMKTEQRTKKDLAEIDSVRLETVDDGLCVQAMHIGPYADETRTIAAMRELMDEEGLRACGPHHEVYFSDPNRTPPGALRTILRQPVRRIAEDAAPCSPDEW